MKIFEEAPEKGTAYILFSKEMIYTRYEKQGDSIRLADGRELSEATAEGFIEIHLFDKEKEVRAVNSRINGIIECSLPTDLHGEYETYIEDIFLINQNDFDGDDYGDHRVQMIHYITYDAQDDYLLIPTYRLREV